MNKQLYNRDSDWICAKCKETNFGSNRNCRKCNHGENDWICGNCMFVNFSQNSNCKKCSVDKSSAVQKFNEKNQTQSINLGNQVAQKKSDWICSCGELNFARNVACRKCNNQKSNELSTSNSQIIQKKGDWICSCGELNFARNNSCRKCKKNNELNQERTNSIVSIKKGDWICRCNEHNFSKNTTCRKCNVPKSNDCRVVTEDQQMQEKTEENKMCCVCLDKELQYASIKCGHLCMCEICKDFLDKCPICRAPINSSTDLIRIYS